MEYDDELERMRRRRQRTGSEGQRGRRSSGQLKEAPKRSVPPREVRRRREAELNIIEFDDLESPRPKETRPKHHGRAHGQRSYEGREYDEINYDDYDEIQYNDTEYEKTSKGSSKKRKNKRKKKRRFGFLKLLMLCILIAGGYLAYTFLWTGTGVWTVAVFGVDSRNGSLEKGALSDVEMLCVIDRGTGEIKLLSVYRDTYMEIHPDGTYHKINEAYFKGGHEQAVEALERNLDVKIDDYATFNWKAVADAITILGGIDLEISDSEFQYINGFITETVESTGLGSHHLEHGGMNHLDGVQAVAYARLRLMDTDYNRTARQRLVIQLALNKAKEADMKTRIALVQAIIPQLSTSIGIDDLLPMAKNVRKYHIGETGGFPFSRGETDIGKKDCVIPLTLESNVVQLHQFLYGTENYVPSQTVRQISARIASDSGMGQVAENAPEAKILGQRALEGENAPESSGKGSGGGDNQGMPSETAPSKPPETEAPSEGIHEEESAEESSEESSSEEETTGAKETVVPMPEDSSSPDPESDGPGGPASNPANPDGPGGGSLNPGSSEVDNDGPGSSGSDNPDAEPSHAGPQVYDEKPVIETQEVGPGVP